MVLISPMEYVSAWENSGHKTYGHLINYYELPSHHALLHLRIMNSFPDNIRILGLRKLVLEGMRPFPRIFETHKTYLEPGYRYKVPNLVLCEVKACEMNVC